MQARLWLAVAKVRGLLREVGKLFGPPHLSSLPWCLHSFGLAVGIRGLRLQFQDLPYKTSTKLQAVEKGSSWTDFGKVHGRPSVAWSSFLLGYEQIFHPSEHPPCSGQSWLKRRRVSSCSVMHEANTTCNPNAQQKPNSGIPPRSRILR